MELTPAQVAAKKAAGTYAGYLHGEIMRVVPTYIALGSVVLLFALALSRMRFPTMTSEHEGEAEGMGALRRCCTIRSYGLRWRRMCCNVGAQISMWSNIIFYMKQYTPVSEKTRGGLHHLFAGGDAGGAVRYDAADEVCVAEQAAGDLWRGECGC